MCSACVIFSPQIHSSGEWKAVDCSACLVFILVSSLQNPALADIYTEHAHQVVVAKYAPSGFYIASGGTCARMARGCVLCGPEFPRPDGTPGYRMVGGGEGEGGGAGWGGRKGGVRQVEPV